MGDEAVRRGWFVVPPIEARKVRITGFFVLAFFVIALIVAGLAGLAWWMVPVGLVGLVLCWKPHLVLRKRTTLGSTVRPRFWASGGTSGPRT